MVRRVNQVLRNQCGRMVKFVSKRATFYYVLCRCLISVSDCHLAPDIVSVSGGNSREYSLVNPRCMHLNLNMYSGLTGLQKCKRLCSNSFQG